MGASPPPMPPPVRLAVHLSTSLTRFRPSPCSPSLTHPLTPGPQGHKMPTNDQERLKVLKLMHAHSQFCLSGDHTVDATKMAIQKVRLTSRSAQSRHAASLITGVCP